MSTTSNETTSVSKTFAPGTARVLTVIYPGQFRKTVLLRVAGPDVTDEAALEQVFEEWNYGSCRESKAFLDSKVRSLSVNDIVGFGLGADVAFYQCAGIGWVKVSAEYVEQLEREVNQHPLKNSYDPCSAWRALDTIMWERCKQAKTTSLSL